MDDLITLARAEGPHGEVVLRRRGRGEEAVEELIVNGAFAMDSAETASERALARLPFPYRGADVLLGGLGLGYTAAELVQAGVGSVDVAELEPALVAWARAGVTPLLGRVAADPRVRLHVADVADLLAGRDRGPWDAVLLDVDNGPDFLIHPPNADLYADAGLRLAFGRLRHDGLLAVWCQGPAPQLSAALTRLGVGPREHHYPVRRGARTWSAVIYTARRPPGP